MKFTKKVISKTTQVVIDPKMLLCRHSGLDPESSDFEATSLDTGFRRYDSHVLFSFTFVSRRLVSIPASEARRESF
jgi:hypothetical protein